MAKANKKQRNLIILIILATGVLLAKSAQLQLFNKKYQIQAQRNTLEQQIKYPARGLIYDRNGKLMVINKPIYELKVVYNKVNPEMDTSFFCSLLNITKEKFEENLNKNWSDVRYHKSIAFTFMSKISPEVFARFQEHLFQFSGFSPSIRNIRSYPQKHAAHLLGYLGEVNQRNIDNEETDYRLGDYIGKSGLERYYEDKLMGKKGIQYLFKDNLGNEVSSYRDGSLDLTADEGVDITTTIDLDLQSFGEQLMINKRGSIVAIDPSSGEILTMLSAPCYDPNLLNLDEDRSDAYLNLLNDTLNKPFLDRTTLAKYPPGSIFKPVLSLIAYQEGVSYPSFAMSCPSEYTYRSFTYGCHNHIRPINIETALVHSCNSYFFQMVRDVIEKEGWTKPGIGMDILRNHLTKFGLGHKLGLDVNQEKSGFIPSSKFYDKLYVGNKWRSTYVMSIGIGQGELELTTVQMANLAAIISNRGKYYTPHIVKEFSDGESIDPKFKQIHSAGIDDKHYDRVINGMKRVVSSGTGYKAHVPGIDICGKTGTSENAGKDHSVFFAFAPRDNPKIAIAVYVENAGFGGDIAAPIAGLMIEQYLNKEINPYRQSLIDRIQNIDLLEKPKVKPEL